MKRFVVYSQDDVEFFDTLEEAEACAVEWIESYSDDGGGEWDEAVTQIFIAELKYTVQQTNVVTPDMFDDSGSRELNGKFYSGDPDYWCDYELKEFVGTATNTQSSDTGLDTFPGAVNPKDLDIAISVNDPSTLVDGCGCDPEVGHICELCFTHGVLCECKRTINMLTAKPDAAAGRSCRWRYDTTHDKYDTECGHGWHFSNDGGFQENGVVFCPFCGGKVTT